MGNARRKGIVNVKGSLLVFLMYCVAWWTKIIGLQWHCLAEAG